MSAYKDALHICASERGERMNLAVNLLKQGEGVVVLDDQLALRPEAEGILCEVIASSQFLKQVSPKMRNELERCQSLLRDSSLYNAIKGKKLTWLVVDDYGMGTQVLWDPSEDSP